MIERFNRKTSQAAVKVEQSTLDSSTYG
ncbi:MAG: hypothetical protein D6816_02680 [Bacteroidetes bacterium]|nr:MAG: hypothetical protein D6816_02680 [Bacteroidota bacterium]